MSGQVSRGSAGEYQADEQAGADGPWDVDTDYYKERFPRAIEEIKEMAAKQQAAAEAKIAALEEELAALK